MSKVTLLTPGRSRLELPLYESRVPAGFPSPANEYLGDTLDLNQYLIANPTATFFARVEGDSMIGAGIYEGDLLVVDRSRTAGHNDIVIAAVDNEFTVKRLDTRDGIRLVAENPDYAPICLSGEREMLIWGVVTGLVRKFSGKNRR
jgi:DNA polymerase V